MLVFDRIRADFVRGRRSISGPHESLAGQHPLLMLAPNPHGP